MDKGLIAGVVTLREVQLISQVEPYQQNEYLMANSNGVDVPLEVMETSSVPMVIPELIPGCQEAYLKKAGIDLMKPAYLAKAKVLTPLSQPLFPLSAISKPDFDEIQSRLIYADVEDSMKLGVIRGTEALQKELPKNLANLAPMWKDKKGIPQNGVPFLLDHHSFREYPHIGIFGTSGSGKTFGLRVLMEELMRIGVPGLVIDPHYEMDYTRQMDGLGEEFPTNFKDSYETFYVGQNMGIAFEELTFEELVYLFEFVGVLSEPMKGALEAVFDPGDTLIYLKQKITHLRDAFEMKERPKREQEDLPEEVWALYEQNKNRIAGSPTMQALSWRLDTLEGTDIFKYKRGIQGIETAIRNGKMAILRGDMRRIQMVSFYAIRKLYKKRRQLQDYHITLKAGNNDSDMPDYFPPFFVVVDEAHNFAPKTHSNPTKRILKTISQEARKYGVFEIFCTQKPDGLDETIFAQLNTKIIYRMNTFSDMQMIQKETNLNEEQMAQLPDLPSGHCFVSSATLPKTFAVRFRTTFTQSPHSKDPFEELAEKKVAITPIKKALLEQCNPTLRKPQLAKLLPELNELFGVSLEDVEATLNEMVGQGLIAKQKALMGYEYTLLAAV